MRFLSLLLIVSTLVACTQPAAPINYRGKDFFGKEHEHALDSGRAPVYAEDSSRYKSGYVRPVENAAVSGVGVSELPPPTEQVSAPVSVTSTDVAPPITTEPESKVLLQETTQEIKAAPAQEESLFIWPLAEGKVIARFGKAAGGKHNDGINIEAAEGEPIWASAAGEVIYAGNEVKDYGNMAIIRHQDGWMSAYAHARSLSVSKGIKIRQGELIGYVGNSGAVKQPQLHFALRKNKQSVDPEQYLPARGF